jgi:hypothetical protein
MDDMSTETVSRAYDGKQITWECRFMPELVPNYKRISKKDYCNPYFWIIIDVKDNQNEKD